MGNDNSYGKILYKDDEHQFIWLGADEEEDTGVIMTNQFLIIHKGRGILLDPGGLHLFSRVVSVASRFINLDDIDAIFFSHQDPDVSSGIALWLGVTKAKIYISGLWVRFLPHFGLIDTKRISPLNKPVMEIPLGGTVLKALPAHFLHSVGCYCLFDPIAKILFTGDIGAADIQYTAGTLMVEDFESHLPALRGFHSRYMTSKKVTSRWASMVRRHAPEMLVPQHGKLFGGENVGRFLDWIGNLDCGIDLIDKLYGDA